MFPPAPSVVLTGLVLACLLGVPAAFGQGRPASPKATEGTPATDPARQALGLRIFRRNCAACHDDPLVIAPQLRNRRHWAQLMRQHTREEFYEDAIHGEGKMPARGGDPSLSDDEVKAAVDYILDWRPGH